MAIKERKQITGTTEQIDAYAGHEGQIVWDKEKKTLVGMSGTAGTNYPLASQIYVASEVAKKASLVELTEGLAGKANASHTHAVADVTGLQVALDGKLGTTAKAESAKVADSANSVSWSNVTGKPSIPASPRAYITETWWSGPSGYRVWSDGYKEQWGIYIQGFGANRTAIVTLPKAFSNTDYNITESILAYTKPVGGDTTYGIISKSASGFLREVDDYMDGFEWKACGY